MESPAGILLIGAAAFAATNVDDLFLLVAWFSAGRWRSRDIVLGQYAGIGILYAMSVAATLAFAQVPPGYLRWLGLIPVLIGLKQLLESRRETGPVPAARGVIAVAAVTLANGGDNLGVYIPLFSAGSPQAIAACGVVFAAMTALWCSAAHWLVSHPAAGAPLRRYGPRAAPFVLVGIGLYIVLR